MKSNAIVRTAALLAALCVSVPVFAKPFVKTVSISQSAKIGQVTLKAGEYQLSIDGDKVTVQRGKEQLVQSQGRWEERNLKSDYNSVLIDANGQVREVRFAGKSSVFVLSE